jgi:hypothetical protein
MAENYLTAWADVKIFSLMVLVRSWISLFSITFPRLCMGISLSHIPWTSSFMSESNKTGYSRNFHYQMCAIFVCSPKGEIFHTKNSHWSSQLFQDLLPLCFLLVKKEQILFISCFQSRFSFLPFLKIWHVHSFLMPS